MTQLMPSEPPIREGESGSIEEGAAFSFYPTKNFTTIEGGLFATNDRALAKRIRILALHGISKNAWKRLRSEADLHWQLLEPGFNTI